MSPATSTDECSCRTATDAESTDLAVPGDPWIRIHYHFGQLLSAEEFRLEQNHGVLRRRLHNVALHGIGTVLGLKVRASAGREGPGRLIVEPGLAIDARGREILVPDKQCLDLRGLEESGIWNGMATDGDARIGYVVLRHMACLSRPEFSLEPACTPEEGMLAYGAIRDGFRIDLEAQAPLDDRPPWFTAFSRLSAGSGGDLRDRWLRHALDLADSDWDLFQSLWREDKDAPLLLARVRLVIEEGRVVASPDPDNSVRALLPQVQALGEILAGTQLAAAPAPARLRSGRPTLAAAAGGAPLVRLAFSRPVLAATLAGAISLRRLGPAGWTALDVAQLRLSPDRLSAEVEAAGTYAADMTISVSLSGAGPEPLLDDDKQPLAGLAGGADPGAGIGSDVHLILNGGA